MTQTRSMLLNVGPSHPAMHGTVRMVLEVEGEKIRSVDVQVGFLHRCFEKHAESLTYQQTIPFTDRMDYLNSLGNNLAYALSIEKLLGCEIPERATVLRVLLAEMTRLASHVMFIGAMARAKILGLEINCGCFGNNEKLGTATLIRDR